MNEIFTMKNIIIYILLINLISFLAMYIDKKKARSGQWRIKESTLLLFVAMGGWIGGLLGMKIFRHKTKKPKFVIGFPLIIITEIICYIIFVLIK